MFQSSLLSFPLFLPLFLCFLFSLGLCHFLFSSSCPPFFYFFPFLLSLLPSFLPALSAHSSATIEAIEAIEVKDAEGKALTHVTVCVWVCVYTFVRVRARVCVYAAWLRSQLPMLTR